MTDDGLDRRADPSALFLADRRRGVPGSVVVPDPRRHRPLLVEVQALVASARPPVVPAARRRASTPAGWRSCSPCSSSASGSASLALDVYASAVGGVRVTEPGADLGVALALASARVAARRCRPDLVALRRGRPRRRAAPGRADSTARWPRRRALGFDSSSCRSRRRTSVEASVLFARRDARRRARRSSECRGDVEAASLVTTRPSPQLRSRRGCLVAAPPCCRPRSALSRRAPPLREGLDRILQANMGALIVVGDGPEVLNICSGGFLLDAAFSPQRLSELAKMDGAIILAADASRIARANVHLVPEPERADVARPAPATAPPSVSPARSTSR